MHYTSTIAPSQAEAADLLLEAGLHVDTARLKIRRSLNAIPNHRQRQQLREVADALQLLGLSLGRSGRGLERRRKQPVPTEREEILDLMADAPPPEQAALHACASDGGQP